MSKRKFQHQTTLGNLLSLRLTDAEYKSVMDWLGKEIDAQSDKAAKEAARKTLICCLYTLRHMWKFGAYRAHQFLSYFADVAHDIAIGRTTADALEDELCNDGMIAKK